MEGPPLGPGGEDITWPNQVAPRGQRAPSTRKFKTQTSNLIFSNDADEHQQHPDLVHELLQRHKLFSCIKE